MHKSKWRYALHRRLIVLILVCLELGVGLVPMLMVPALSQIQLASRRRVIYTPPPNGAPGRSSQGGSRDGCPKGILTALSPDVTHWGETIDERPTFWLHIPFQSGAVELVLEDETVQEVVYRDRFQVTSTPGVASFSMSDASPALEVDKIYGWELDFFCDPNSSLSNFQVSGVIVRRSPSTELSSQLAQASPEDRVAIFAENGFWYNALTELAELRRANPQDTELNDSWSSLLQHPVVNRWTIRSRGAGKGWGTGGISIQE